MAKKIDIGGELHSVATGNIVADAKEIKYRPTGKEEKTQAQVNDELIEAVGSGGGVDARIASAVNAAKAEIKGDATSACDTLGEAEALISAETIARQSAISNVIGDAASDYNTLGKLEDKIQAEATRAEAAEGALDGRVDTLEDAVGTGGSIDSRISDAVAIETTRAQGAESQLSSGKADKATTLAGYGITDAYTKSETYTKTEVNGLVDTPHQEYETVDAYANLPATGSKDTIYRVSNYNGSTSQVDASVYSEYAWDGAQYVFLCVKSQIGEVFDISVYNNNAKYADLAAALNGGANIPQSLQKGGMSVKFVCSSDNKYIQYRLMSDEWSTDTDDWSIYEDTTLIENPEFVEVNTDAKGKILYGVNADGNFYFGAGTPSQVKESINESAATKVDKETNKSLMSFDEHTKLATLPTNTELQTLFATKVDKVEGESLIDKNFAEDVPEIVSVVDNPEYMSVETDAYDKILGGRRVDGTKFENCPTEIPAAIIESVDSPEWLQVTTDIDGRVLEGRKIDGTIYESTKDINKKWFGKTWACLGDSLTEANRKTTKHYFDYIKEDTGIYTLNFGIGGTGYARHKESGYAFFQRAAKIPKCDIVTIFGSFNDSASSLSMGDPTDTGTNTICGCINETINVLQSNHPFMPIGIIASVPWANGEPNDGPGATWYEEYVQKQEEICKLRGIPFLDLYHTSNMHPTNATFRAETYDAEGVHPNAMGHKIFYPRIKAFIESIIN